MWTPSTISGSVFRKNIAKIFPQISSVCSHCSMWHTGIILLKIFPHLKFNFKLLWHNFCVCVHLCPNWPEKPSHIWRMSRPCINSTRYQFVSFRFGALDQMVKISSSMNHRSFSDYLPCQTYGTTQIADLVKVHLKYYTKSNREKVIYGFSVFLHSPLMLYLYFKSF